MAPFCSKQAGWITGHVIYATDGASLMNPEVPRKSNQANPESFRGAHALTAAMGTVTLLTLAVCVTYYKNALINRR